MAFRTGLHECYRDTFPNPLNVPFGEGRINVSSFMGKDGKTFGVYFKDTGEPHEIGANIDESESEHHEPEQGEIYLTFSNVESARVVIERLEFAMRVYEMERSNQ